MRKARRSGTPRVGPTSTPPAGRSWSTSGTVADRSPTRCASRPVGSPTPMGRRSPAKRWRRTPPSWARTCRSTTRRSTRCRAVRRRSRPRSSSPGRITSPGVRSIDSSCSAAGGATTATRSAPSTCPDASRSAGPTRVGSAGSGTLSAAYPYRAGDPGADALETAEELAAELERAIEASGPGTVAAFVAEPIVGATLAGAVPPDGYWPAIAEVCRRHGVLLIADEVMTGFGRTGRWFGLDHWGDPARSPRGGQGCDLGLLAVRVRRGVGSRCTRRSRRPAPGSSMASPTATTSSGRRWPARSCGSSRRRRWSRRARRRASACAGSSSTASATTRTSARSAVAGC